MRRASRLALVGDVVDGQQQQRRLALRAMMLRALRTQRAQPVPRQRARDLDVDQRVVAGAARQQRAPQVRVVEHSAGRLLQQDRPFDRSAVPPNSR